MLNGDLSCDEIRMRPGDVLYLPKGVVHEAVSRTRSAHLTISLKQDGLTWSDFFVAAIDGIPARVADGGLRELLATALSDLSKSVPAGVAWQRVTPIAFLGSDAVFDEEALTVIQEHCRALGAQLQDAALAADLAALPVEVDPIALPWRLKTAIKELCSTTSLLDGIRTMRSSAVDGVSSRSVSKSRHRRGGSTCYANQASSTYNCPNSATTYTKVRYGGSSQGCDCDGYYGSDCDCDSAYKWSDCRVTRSHCTTTCSDGTFLSGCDTADAPNGGSCGSCPTWRTCSSPTQYQSAAGNANSNRVCATCPSGRATSSNNQVGIDSCLGIKRTCTGSTYDRTLADIYAETDCIAWTTCFSPGHYQSAAGTAASDRVCTHCPSGEGTLSDNEVGCTQLGYVIQAGATSLRITSNGDPPAQTQIELMQYDITQSGLNSVRDADGTSYDVSATDPRRVDSSSGAITITDLNPGSLFFLRVLAVDSSNNILYPQGESMRDFYEYSGNNAIATHCGCPADPINGEPGAANFIAGTEVVWSTSTDAAGAVTQSDQTGKPTKFLAAQANGKITFSWIDHSRCESSFSVERQVGSSADIMVFAPDFAHSNNNDRSDGSADRSCGQALMSSPGGSFSDDLGTEAAPAPFSAVGTSLTYYLSAGSDIGVGTKGYRSNPAEMAVSVRFESLVQGQVLSKFGSVPTFAVQVSWEVHRSTANLDLSPTPLLTGTLLLCEQGTQIMGCATQRDGTFEVHILDDGAVPAISSNDADNLDVVITFIKYTPDNSLYTFEYEAPGSTSPTPLSNGQLRVSGIRHLKFDRSPLKVLDASSRPFSGKVTFPSLAPVIVNRYDKLIAADTQPSWPSSWDTREARQASDSCSLSNVLVCLHDAETGTTIHCDESEAITGVYALSAPVGTTVYVKLVLDHHPLFARLLDQDKDVLVQTRTSTFIDDPIQMPGTNNQDQVEAFDIKVEHDQTTWTDVHFWRFRVTGISQILYSCVIQLLTERHPLPNVTLR